MSLRAHARPADRRRGGAGRRAGGRLRRTPRWRPVLGAARHRCRQLRRGDDADLPPPAGAPPHGQLPPGLAAWAGRGGDRGLAAVGPQGPDELAADLELAAAGDLATAPTVEVCGAVLGTQHDADGLLDELTALAGADPLSRACTELSYRDTVRYQAAPDAGDGPAAPGAAQGQAALASHLAGQRTAGQDRSVIFAPWAGAYNRQPAQATAFARRAASDSCSSTWPSLSRGRRRQRPIAPPTSGSRTRGHRCIPGGRAGCSPNFPDPDLADWGRAYYSDNYPRLRNRRATGGVGSHMRPDVIRGCARPQRANAR